MIYARIAAGVVVDRCVFPAAMPADWPNRAEWVDAAAAQIGWTYDGTAFTPPPPAVPSPEEVADAARATLFVADAGRADLLARLRTATPAQIDTWLLANVTTLVQARGVLGAVIKRLIAKGLL